MAFAFFRTQKEVTVATVTDTITKPMKTMLSKTNEEILPIPGQGGVDSS